MEDKNMTTNKIKNFQLFKQQKSDDCWIASCKMTIDYLNNTNYNYANLLKKAGTISTAKQGGYDGILELLHLAAPTLSYQGEIVIDKTIDDFKDLIIKNIDNNRPVIVGLPGHAVVIIGYDSVRRVFITADPYTGKENEIKYGSVITDICYSLK